MRSSPPTSTSESRLSVMIYAPHGKTAAAMEQVREWLARGATVAIFGWEDKSAGAAPPDDRPMMFMGRPVRWVESLDTPCSMDMLQLPPTIKPIEPLSREAEARHGGPRMPTWFGELIRRWFCPPPSKHAGGWHRSGGWREERRGRLKRERQARKAHYFRLRHA